jgi:hypothetical protein
LVTLPLPRLRLVVDVEVDEEARDLDVVLNDDEIEVEYVDFVVELSAS